MLEMAGIPYVASSPLGHALSLDKVVTKILLSSAGIPTPAYQVLERKGDPLKPGLRWPLVVKPRHEAVSFGLRVCREEPELREGAQVILQTYQQPVLVEEYIEGREVNVAILGNSPPVALPPVELDFGDGPRIYTYEDKTHRSGRTIGMLCPAPIGEELTARVQDLARRAFSAVGLLDCCRVDMRIAEDGGVWVLETNSLPSLGEHGSYVEAALKAGFTFNGLVNRILEVAEQRYFGA
jgi:D-alanine-D-alanine ligase